MSLWDLYSFCYVVNDILLNSLKFYDKSIAI